MRNKKIVRENSVKKLILTRKYDKIILRKKSFFCVNFKISDQKIRKKCVYFKITPDVIFEYICLIVCSGNDKNLKIE